ncbi:hypothetical protein CMV_026038 [Castanea mollissima]|uniref:Uncharacterized protein n=1 Tax=Castanea mollissima TaxID=60419 RepID=A0A8J4QKM1_9ROSI|nr:hypothetical protein CMV_026038 [Castanea mollissima]
MPRNHDYYRWYRPVTRKYVDRNSAKLDISIESHFALLEMLPPDTDVPDEHPPHQPSPPRGRPQRARRAPTCGTGGHKIGHKGSSMHDDEPKDDAPQPPPPPKHYTRVKKRKIGEP